MNAMVVVDARVWACQFIAQDVNYEASKTWITQFVNESGTLIEPNFLLLEVAASIARQRVTDIEAKKIVIDMKESSDIIKFMPLNTRLLQVAIDVAADLQLRAGDAIYVAVAYQRHIPLVSWDKEQLQKASKIVQTYTPDTYPFVG